MQHPNRESVVKLSRERETINVSLNYVYVRQRASGAKCCLDSDAQIDANNFPRSPTCGQLSVTTLTTPSFEHNLVAKELRRYRRDPTQELLRVFFIRLGKVLPLPAEVFSSGAFVTLDLFQICETRDSARYRKRSSA